MNKASAIAKKRQEKKARTISSLASLKSVRDQPALYCMPLPL
jgi:hypothetical protein